MTTDLMKLTQRGTINDKGFTQIDQIPLNSNRDKWELIQMINKRFKYPTFKKEHFLISNRKIMSRKLKKRGSLLKE